MAKKKRSRYGDGCLYLRGRIWWAKWREVRRRPDGSADYVQHYRSTGSEDRVFALRVLRSELQKLGGRRPMDADPGKVTWEQVRANYLAHCAAQGRRSLKKGPDGNPTLDTLPPLDAFFAGWRVSEIGVADLKRFRAESRAAGRGEARINRCVAVLRAALRQAVKDEMLTAAEIPGHFPIVNEPNVARGAVFVERAWYGALRKELSEPLRSAFTLAYWTGLRVGEMERLRWRDFDFRSRRVHLDGSITKTGRSRTVPLPRDFDLRPGKPDELALPLGDRRKAWRRACVTVGAGRWEGKRYVGLLLRHCRHSAVRNMSDAGLPEARIMAISGHETRAVFDRYNIGRASDADAALDALERFHGRTVTKRNQ